MSGLELTQEQKIELGEPVLVPKNPRMAQIIKRKSQEKIISEVLENDV